MDGRITHIEADVERLMKIVSDGNGQPALTVQVATMSSQVSEMKETLEGLPNKLLTWLLIFGAAITIITFLGPSVRKALSLATNHRSVVLARDNKQDATIPTLRGN